jgi:hypothetical protein
MKVADSPTSCVICAASGDRADIASRDVKADNRIAAPTASRVLACR